MRVLVTDLTYMTEDTCCVAGWCSDETRMIRPLPDGHHWSVELIGHHQISVGTVIAVDRGPVQHTSDYPHRTEDVRIRSDSIANVEQRSGWWHGAEATPVASSMEDVFEGHMRHTRTWQGNRKGLYVMKETKSVSLGAIEIARDAVRFEEEDSFGIMKMRGILRDGTITYDLPVSSLGLHRIHVAEGIDAVNASLPAIGRLHVRLGLARGWKEKPNECRVMLNGIVW